MGYRGTENSQSYREHESTGVAIPLLPVFLCLRPLVSWALSALRETPMPCASICPDPRGAQSLLVQNAGLFPHHSTGGSTVAPVYGM
jgi:hypothetical protein